jgi:hypothetical protein
MEQVLTSEIGRYPGRTLSGSDGAFQTSKAFLGGLSALSVMASSFQTWTSPRPLSRRMTLSLKLFSMSLFTEKILSEFSEL